MKAKESIRSLANDVVNKLLAQVSILSIEDVVRELVQNSIDAGARNITVKLDITYLTIYVIDDGCGIAVGDLQKLGRRHVTSKITDLADAGRFFGFRGEALFALSRVSDLRVISKRKLAKTYCVNVTKHEPTVEFDFDDESINPRNKNSFHVEELTSSGTVVIVRNLFGGFPVREKQILQTSQFTILDRIRYELLPNIKPVNLSVWFNNNGVLNCLFNITEQHNLLNGIFGLSKTFTRIRCKFEDLALTCVISKQPVSSRKFQFVTINDRPLHLTREMQNTFNSIFHNSNYGSLTFVLPRRKSYPAFFAQFSCSSSLLDELIQDPAKRIWSSTLHDTIVSLLKKAFMQFLLSQGFRTGSSPRRSPVKPLKPPKFNIDALLNTHNKLNGFRYIEEQVIQRLLVGDYRIVNQFDKKFILVMIGPQLFAFDQHACDERIRVEELYKIWLPKLTAQTVECDIALECNTEELAALLHVRDNLKRYGVDLTSNRNEVKIVSIPSILEGRTINLKEQLMEYCDDVSLLYKTHLQESLLIESNLPGFLTEAVNSKACRSAITFGTLLSRDEMIQMIRRLAVCRMPFRCAHGRPSIAPLYDVSSYE